MAFFQSLLSYEFTASLTVLGSSLVIDKAKLEQKLGGLYLYGCLISLTDLLNTGVCGSSSSSASSSSDD
jgi:hypothetical protein